MSGDADGNQTILARSSTPTVLLFGTQKSGTTWLRNIFSVACPVCHESEWQLPVLFSHIEQFVAYCGARAHPPVRVVTAIVAAAYEAALDAGSSRIDKSAYPCLPEAGRDDRLFPHAMYLNRMVFPDARCIMIVRDPRAVFLSACHYFGLSVHDPDLASIEAFADSWSRCNLRWLEDDPDHVVRYEDLKRSFEVTTRDMFAAAGIDLSAAERQCLVERYGTIQFSQRQDPVFYRSGSSEEWRTALPTRVSDAIAATAALAMDVFDYA